MMGRTTSNCKGIGNFVVYATHIAISKRIFQNVKTSEFVIITRNLDIGIWGIIPHLTFAIMSSTKAQLRAKGTATVAPPTNLIQVEEENWLTIALPISQKRAVQKNTPISLPKVEIIVNSKFFILY
jgi:hypothetical protein